MSAPSSQPEVRILPDGETLRRAAADEIIKAAQETLRTRKVFTLALAGGSTPPPYCDRRASRTFDDEWGMVLGGIP